MSLNNPSVAIVGATGAVGMELISCLERRDFPLHDLRLFATARSAGRILAFRGEGLQVMELTENALFDCDIALFSAGASVSCRFAPEAVRQGAVVVDNSSAYRMEPNVPLVVPEVNAGAIAAHRGIIANPNCVAAIAAVPLWPLHCKVGIARIVAATYQAASGAGAAALAELRMATGAFIAGKDFTPSVLRHPYAFNLFSHDTAVDRATGSNAEEIKVVHELRKIMQAPCLPIGITCIRVPVLRAHSIALTVELSRTIEPDEARRILAAAPSVKIVDDSENNHFPMPSEASGQGDVLVGRIRRDASDPTGRSLALFVAGDQLLKGAALNAVQIAEHLVH